MSVIAWPGAAHVAPAWHDVQRVLAVRLDNLGDVLMTTPALAALRRGLPHAHIALLASPAAAALAPHLGMVDEVIPFDAPWVRSTTSDAVCEIADAAAREREDIALLAARRFDAAVIFTVCTQSALPAALLARWAGIGLRLAHARENPYRLLTHGVRDNERIGDAMRHEVQRQLDLVASVGFTLPLRDDGLRFRRRAEDDAALLPRLARAGIEDDERLVVVHPGSTAESRRWPAERFGRCAAQVARQSRSRVVFVGGAADAQAVRDAAVHAPGAACFVDELNLGELAALLARAAVVLCNNSAPAHLAAAVGAPVVVAYALTNPQHTPWRARSRVLYHDVACRWCLASRCPHGHQRCLQGVPADDMTRAALDLMREEQSAARRKREPKAIRPSPLAGGAA